MDSTKKNPQISDFVKSLDVPGKVIFAKVWGSHSHNTDLPSSDVDYAAVYVAPTARILSLQEPPDTVSREKPDCQAHELKKFCRLLLKGNPAILEMLYTEKMVYWTNEWEAVRQARRLFLSQQSVKQYLGYAQGQLNKLRKHNGDAGLHTKGGKYSEKWGYHIIRLLLDAQRIAEGGVPIVWKDGDEREQLMLIRTKKYGQDRIEEWASALIKHIENLKPWPLPEQGDEKWLNNWMLKIRQREMPRGENALVSSMLAPHHLTAQDFAQARKKPSGTQRVIEPQKR